MTFTVKFLEVRNRTQMGAIGPVTQPIFATTDTPVYEGCDVCAGVCEEPTSYMARNDTGKTEINHVSKL